MNGKTPTFRITIKELTLELEDENLVQSLGRSLTALFAQAAPPEPFTLLVDDEAHPRRRGRGAKAAAARGRKSRRPRADAATAQIRKLRDEGYFATPRRASEVKETLKTLGYELENRQVYATLKYMADKHILSRSQTGEDGAWMYSAAPA